MEKGVIERGWLLGPRFELSYEFGISNCNEKNNATVLDDRLNKIWN